MCSSESELESDCLVRKGNPDDGDVFETDKADNQYDSASVSSNTELKFPSSGETLLIGHFTPSAIL